eukprot:348963-Prymnesium_polylepis.1
MLCSFTLSTRGRAGGGGASLLDGPGIPAAGPLDGSGPMAQADYSHHGFGHGNVPYFFSPRYWWPVAYDAPCGGSGRYARPA